ncbi:LysM peptidoglycan-binding domain-containing protein [Bacillaceae bacterium W0354]
MSTNGSEPILFDLEEKIIFRQGEEIDDLYGISIQPDINVFQEATHIQLRGVLMVSGEYQSVPREEPVYLVDEDQDEETYVQQVKALDNGFTTFQYPIPVDITIPSNRVTETGEPEVDIEYFDYELPEPKSLHVFAKIRLDGVEMTQTEEERPEFNPDFELKAVPTIDYSFDDNHEVEQKEEVAETIAEAEENLEEQSNDANEEKEREFWKKKNKSQSLQEFFQKKEEKAKASDVEEYEDDYEDSIDEEEYYDAEEHDYDEDDEPDVESSDEEKPKKKGLKYLANLFRSEEPEKVQLKIRFVQEDETLDSIASAYEISVSKLERLNGLEEGYEIKTGDVLYVPKKTKKTS